MVDDVGNIVSGAQRAQLLSLQKTARQLDVTSARLASGQKVSSALDNPDSFFLARSLNNRADDLDRLLDGIGQNIRVIEEADHGLKAELKILDIAEAYLQDIEKKYLAGEIGTSTGAPDNETYITFAANTDLAHYAPGQDTAGFAGITVPAENEVNFSGNYWRRKAINYTITSDTVLVFEYRSTVAPDIAAIGFDNDITFGNDNDRFFLHGTQTNGVPYSAPVPTYRYSGSGNWETIEIPIGTYFTGAYSWITFLHDDDLAPPGNSRFRNITLREGPVQPGPQIADDGLTFEEGYAKIVDQLDQIARDAHYRGVNLLKNEDMLSVFNEDRSSTLLTEGLDATRAGLGLTIEDFDTVEAVQAKIAEVRAARNILRAYGSTLATNLNVLQVRDVFTRETINTHKKGAGDLTDADLNEEGATMLALQTMQQLQTTMLSLRPANVLSVLA